MDTDIDEHEPPARAKWRVVKAEVLREIVIGHIGIAAQEFRNKATILYPNGAFNPFSVNESFGQGPDDDPNYADRKERAEAECGRQSQFHPGFIEV